MTRVTDLFGDKRCASPVVGVIVVVGLTLIVAAVLGSALFLTGSSVGGEPPQTQFDAEQVDGFTVHANGGRSGEYSYVQFEHEGGDTLNLSKVKILVNGVEGYDVYEYGTTGNPGGAIDDCDDAPCHYTTTPNGSLSTGDTIRVVVKGGDVGREARSFTVDDNDVGDPGNGDLVYNEYDNRISLADGDEVRLVFETEDQEYTLATYEVTDPTNIRVG